MDKWVKIKITYSDGRKETLEIHTHLFRKVGLVYNGKFTKFYSLTKIINKIRKNLVEYSGTY